MTLSTMMGYVFIKGLTVYYLLSEVLKSCDFFWPLLASPQKCRMLENCYTVLVCVPIIELASPLVRPISKEEMD